MAPSTRKPDDPEKQQDTERPTIIRRYIHNSHPDDIKSERSDVAVVVRLSVLPVCNINRSDRKHHLLRQFIPEQIILAIRRGRIWFVFFGLS